MGSASHHSRLIESLTNLSAFLVHLEVWAMIRLFIRIEKVNVLVIFKKKKKKQLAMWSHHDKKYSFQIVENYDTSHQHYLLLKKLITSRNENVLSRSQTQARRNIAHDEHLHSLIYVNSYQYKTGGAKIIRKPN